MLCDDNRFLRDPAGPLPTFQRIAYYRYRCPYFSYTSISTAERYAYESRRQLQNLTNAFESHANQTILQAKTTHAHMEEMMQALQNGLEEKAKAQLERLKATWDETPRGRKNAGSRHMTGCSNTSSTRIRYVGYHGKIVPRSR